MNSTDDSGKIKVTMQIVDEENRTAILEMQTMGLQNFESWLNEQRHLLGQNAYLHQ